jgi:NAD-dependent SIR2 family protein deacetylase
MLDDRDRLANLAMRPDTIMFVGSGVSAWSGLPTWGKLLDELATYLESLGKPGTLVRRELSNNDLLLAASYGFDQLTRHEKCDFLHSIFLSRPTRPSELHHVVASLGPRCFVTTNYDTLLESAIRKSRPDEVFSIVTPLQQLEVTSIIQSRAEGFVFKPHGDIGSCDSIILT